MPEFIREVRVIYNTDGSIKGGEIRKATSIVIDGAMREIEHNPVPIAGTVQSGLSLGEAFTDLEADALSAAQLATQTVEALQRVVASLTTERDELKAANISQKDHITAMESERTALRNTVDSLTAQVESLNEKLAAEIAKHPVPSP